MARTRMGMLAAALAVGVALAGCATSGKTATGPIDGTWIGGSDEGTKFEMTITGQNWLQVVTEQGAPLYQFRGTLEVSGSDITLTTTEAMMADSQEWAEYTASAITGVLADDGNSFTLTYESGDIEMTRN